MNKLFIIVIILLFNIKIFASNNIDVGTISLVGLNNKIDRDYYSHLLLNKFGPTIKKGDISLLVEYLYNTGNFQNITWSYIKDKLYFSLIYNYNISEIKFINNKFFDKQKLIDIFNKFDIKKNYMLNTYNLLMIKNYLYDLYQKEGIDVTIDFQFISLKDKNVVLQVVFKEFTWPKIRKIVLSGNTKFNDFQLTKNWYTKVYKNFFHNILVNSIYRVNAFENDLQKLKYFYINKGYLDFTIKRVIKSLVLDDTFIDLYIYLYEGEIYRILDITIQDDLFLFDSQTEEIKNKFFVHEMVYTTDFVHHFYERLLSFYKNKGYLDVVIDVDHHKLKDHYINLKFNVHLGKKFYVRKINIWGNTSTVDSILRKEIVLLEGNVYNESLVRISIENLLKTGFIEDVKIKIKKHYVRHTNLVDITFNLKEIVSYGNFAFNLGLSRNSLLNYKFSFLKKNLLGVGTKLIFDITKGNNIYSINTLLSYPGLSNNNNIYINDKFNFIYKYKLVDNHHSNPDINLNISKEVVYYYNPKKYITVGVNYNYRYLDDYVHIDMLGGLDPNYVSDPTAINKLCYSPYRKHEFLTISYLKSNKVKQIQLLFDYTFNNLKKNIFPISGYYFNLHSNATLLWSDNLYYQITFTWKNYFSLNKKDNFILSFSNFLGYMHSYHNSTIPVYEYFRPYVHNYLRGFHRESLDSIFYYSDLHKKCHDKFYWDCRHPSKLFHGNIMWSFNTELSIPLDHVFGNFYKDYYRLSLFLDSGLIIDNELLSEHIQVILDTHKYNKFYEIFKISAGVAFKVSTPFGVINVSFGSPVLWEAHDRIHFYQLYITNS